MFGRSAEGWNSAPLRPGAHVSANPRARYGGVKTNAQIEKWVAFRETLVYTPSMWTRRRLAALAVFGVALPYVTYRGLVAQNEAQDRTDTIAGRPRA
jgi:hypothetical protein